ncbi:unnamed protein product [Polarella glacialis]|uniref:Uncharacterized protein n=1 Tax=Polarella glacialis TaxID=89957 RepID=A0A813FRQ7_POLGL|nr:unnamed protein product [Polarella glacialis]
MGNRASDLFADRSGDLFADRSGTLFAEVIEEGEATSYPEHVPEDDIALGDDENLSFDLQQLQALLCDNAGFFEACEAAVASVAGTNTTYTGQRPPPGTNKLHTVGDLQSALNHMCMRYGVPEVDDAEAVELWDSPMDSGVFYQFAREYFSSLCRSLAMESHLLNG